MLRPWRTADRAPFAAMNADPEVMRYFPVPVRRGESDAFVDRTRRASPSAATTRGRSRWWTGRSLWVSSAYGFQVAGMDEMVSLTATVDAPSRAVMRRLGMAHDPDEDFDHPAVPVGHPARRHVLYRLRRPRLTDERTETHG